MRTAADTATLTYHGIAQGMSNAHATGLRMAQPMEGEGNVGIYMDCRAAVDEPAATISSQWQISVHAAGHGGPDLRLYAVSAAVRGVRRVGWHAIGARTPVNLRP
jgi:hypothetical protein